MSSLSQVAGGTDNDPTSILHVSGGLDICPSVVSMDRSRTVGVTGDTGGVNEDISGVTGEVRGVNGDINGEKESSLASSEFSSGQSSTSMMIMNPYNPNAILDVLTSRTCTDGSTSDTDVNASRTNVRTTRTDVSTSRMDVSSSPIISPYTENHLIIERTVRTAPTIYRIPTGPPKGTSSMHMYTYTCIFRFTFISIFILI
jgi:hypothetical protein